MTTSEPTAPVPAELWALADRYGIESSYHDIAGTEHRADPDIIVRILGALGCPISTLADAPDASRAVEAAGPSDDAGLTRVAWDGRLTDQGDTTGEPLIDVDTGATLAPTQAPLPFGVYRSGTTTVISAPFTGASSRVDRQHRSVALFAPLFSVHRANGRGFGDFEDLRTLADLSAARGGDGIVTLPLLSRVAGTESPYLPSSRHIFDELWLTSSGDARFVDDEGIIDYETARAGVLQHVATDLERRAAQRRAEHRAELDAFAARQPDEARYAGFRACAERFGFDWTQWPASATPDPARLETHLHAQWMVQRELGATRERFASRGQFLALDLPLGVHPLGYDTWADPDGYVSGIEVGAPPDAFSPRGQRWGFPPVAPNRVGNPPFAQFRAALEAHLRFASVLRIDHVMGLQRLFWIPDGADPSQGVYVRMPMEPLLALVCLHAHREGADVYGEDLGTVSDEIRTAMTEHQLRRSFVAQFSIAARPERDGRLYDPPPAHSVASFATHDLAPFAGWWNEHDIDERATLEIVSDVDADHQRAERTRERELLVRARGVASADAILECTHRELAASEAGIVAVSLDDLLGETRSHNVPGTDRERPNWRLTSPTALDDLFTDTRVALPRRTQLAQGRGEAPHAGALSDDDLHYFNEGRHFRLYRHLGAHVSTAPIVEGTGGEMRTRFATWAPNAHAVSVVGDWNGWDPATDPMQSRGSSGVWEVSVPSVGPGARYKFHIRPLDGASFEKADPFARAAEHPPATASIVAASRHLWSDDAWMTGRRERQSIGAPMSIYEVHLGSWRRPSDDPNGFANYRALARQLAEHVGDLGFTHVELMPVMEHPFYGSWGYQVTSFFAPTSRYGSPDDLRAFVDIMHEAGIGVILDWVPSHFPSDAFALAEYDGTHLFEHADERQRVHPDWKSWIFNCARNEIRSFLASSAMFWLDEFHIDGLRVDAVASMLYLDYSRRPGEWIPNRFGGREYLEAISLLQDVNRAVYGEYPSIVMIAEESTAWPGVTAPAHEGGLGFGFKWDMGWMHDTLEYLRRDPVHRPHHHHELTFRAAYGRSENFVLALSHDEVVHGKGTLLSRMPGDDWQQFANLRLLYGYQWLLDGKKLLFMGSEFGARDEWNHDAELDWSLLQHESHRGIASWIRALNGLYRSRTELHDGDCEPYGFSWIDCDDEAHSMLTFERRDRAGRSIAVVANFTPVPRPQYRIGLPNQGVWRVVADSDDRAYWGSGFRRTAEFRSEPVEWHGRAVSALIDIPPLAVIALAATDSGASGDARESDGLA